MGGAYSSAKVDSDGKAVECNADTNAHIPKCEHVGANGEEIAAHILDPREDAFFQSFHKGCVNVVGSLGTRGLASMVIDSETVCHYDEATYPGVKGLVAITIDDAPARQRCRTKNMCKDVEGLLNEFQAKATFFLCTDHVPGHEDDIIKLLMDGHEVANHCARDRRYDNDTEEDFEDIFKASEAVCEELRRRARGALAAQQRAGGEQRRNRFADAMTQCGSLCSSSSCFGFLGAKRKDKHTRSCDVPPAKLAGMAIAGNSDAAGATPAQEVASPSASGSLPSQAAKPVRWFRAPGAAYSLAMKRVVDRHGFTHVLCDSYANDPWISDAEWIAATLLDHARDGSILVIHMPEKGFREYNFEALRITLEGLRNKGLRSVTLSALAAAASSSSPSPAAATE